ncbi:unnamed protein product [Arabidopsis halleri]
MDMPVSDQKNLSQMNHDPRLEAIVDRMLEKYDASVRRSINWPCGIVKEDGDCIR